MESDSCHRNVSQDITTATGPIDKTTHGGLFGGSWRKQVWEELPPSLPEAEVEPADKSPQGLPSRDVGQAAISSAAQPLCSPPSPAPVGFMALFFISGLRAVAALLPGSLFHHPSNPLCTFSEAGALIGD